HGPRPPAPSAVPPPRPLVRPSSKTAALPMPQTKFSWTVRLLDAHPFYAMGGPTVPLPPTAPRRRPPCHCQSERSRRRLFARVGSGKRNGLRTRGICFLPQPFFEIPSTNFHDSSRRRRTTSSADMFPESPARKSPVGSTN